MADHLRRLNCAGDRPASSLQVPGHGIAPERVLAELATAGLDASVIPEDILDDHVIIASVRTPAPAPAP